MADWTKSMQQTFEYYTVDPGTWKDMKEIKTVTSCNISRDRGAATLGSATIEATESLGECYVRIYLVVTQDDETEKFPLGTYMVQTPTTKYDGRLYSYSLDAYSPLIELKEKQPPIGYSLLKKSKIMDHAFKLVRENARAPVVRADCDETLATDFVSDPNETWLDFLTSLMANAKYSFDLDEKGRILFMPEQDTASLQPVWTYTDDNCSILYPSISIDRDLYGVPNVVEVAYSTNYGNYYARVVNNDEDSPTSTVNRGREIVYRVTNPGLSGEPTQKQVERYAKQVLREVSTVEYSVTYTHGYCPARTGDCVLFMHNSAGLTNVKAKVISQDIKCTPGCPVTEKAVFTAKLWR